MEVCLKWWEEGRLKLVFQRGLGGVDPMVLEGCDGGRDKGVRGWDGKDKKERGRVLERYGGVMCDLIGGGMV